MLLDTVVFRKFDLKTEDEAEWDKLIGIQLQAFQENNPNDPIPPREFMRKSFGFAATDPHTEVTIILAEAANGEVVAMLNYGYPRPESPDFEAQRSVINFDIYVAPTHRRQKIGTHLLKMIVDVAQGFGVETLQVGTTTDEGREFAQFLSMQKGGEVRTSRLLTKDVDWALMETWRTECATENPDVRIETFEGLLEDDLDAYIKLYSEVFNQQPFDDMEGFENTITAEVMRHQKAQFDERGDRWITMITREKDGAISGLTEIAFNPSRPHRVIQMLTGVQEAYRGRSLGKWLKANMMLYIRDELPTVEFVTTNNAYSNAPMVSINVRMGFKIYKHMTAFKAKVADLATKLN